MNVCDVDVICTQQVPSSPEDEILSRLQEQVLVMRTQHRDQQAFQQLMRLYEQRVLYYIRRLVTDLETALDVSQEVWMAVYRSIGSLHSPEAFRVWLFRVAYNKATKAVRRARRRAEVETEKASEEVESESWDECARSEDAHLVHLALQQVSEAHRAILSLRFLEDLTLSEIAEVVGCGVPTAKTRLYYAKKAFRKKYEHVQTQSSLL